MAKPVTSGFLNEPGTLLTPSVLGSVLALGVLAGVCELARRAALLAFLAGTIVGCSGTIVVLVVLLYALTKPGQLGTTLQAAAQPGDLSPSFPIERSGIDGDRPTPPHGIAQRGWFAGVIYVAPLSRWPRDATSQNWPPTREAGTPLSTWYAELDQGTLVLTQEGSDATTSGLLSAPTKLGIPLEGCTVELVRDGLAGRSDFLRRGPLLVSHEHWALFGGEKGFYMFAGDPASKQAWLHALQWWCIGGEQLWASDAWYCKYCDDISQHTIVPFAIHQPVQHRGSSQGPNLTNTPGKSRSSSGPSPWRRLGAVTVAAFRSRRGALNKNESAASLSTEEDSLERFWDRKWMQPGKTSISESTRAAVAAASASKKRTNGAVTGSGQGTPKSGGADVIEVPMRPVPSASGQHLGNNDDSTTTVDDDGDYVPEDEESEPGSSVVGAQADEIARTSTGARTVNDRFFTPSSSPAKNGSTAVENGQGTNSNDYRTTGAPVKAASGAAFNTHAHTSPSHHHHGHHHHPHTDTAPEQAINMFFVRLGFDALRSGWWRDWLFRRLQRQLSRLQVADVVQELRLLEVQPGRAVPTIANARALPCPTPETLWPQLEFDVRYCGDFAIVLETSVDIRDGKVWSRLDETLTKWEMPKIKKKDRDDDDESVYDAGTTSDRSAGAPSSSSMSSTAKPSRGFRRSAAKTLRSLAESTATSIQAVPLRLQLSFPSLEGRMIMWMSPPPGNRLFYAFLEPPKLTVVAKPQLGNRLLKYSAHISRISSIIEQRILASFTKSIVFPGGGDIIVPGMISLHDSNLDTPFAELVREGKGK